MKYKDYLLTPYQIGDNNILVNKIFDETTLNGIEEYFNFLKQNIRPLSPSPNAFGEERSECEVLCKVTSYCNQHCVYCFDVNNHHDKHITLTKEQIMKLLRLLFNKYDCVNWTWHGGECLSVNKKWFDDVCFTMQKYAIEKGKQLTFQAQTNYTLIDKEWIDLINKYKIYIGASYDFTAQKKMRQYDLSNEQLKILDNIICVVTKENVNDLIDIYRSQIKNNTKISFNLVFGNNTHDVNYYLDIDEAITNFKKFFDFYCSSQEAVVPERMAEALMGRALGGGASICILSDCIQNNRICINNDATLWHCDNTNIKEMYICKLDEINDINEYENHPRVQKLKNMKFQLANYKDCQDCEINTVCSRGCTNCILIESNGIKPYSYHCKFFRAMFNYIYDKLGHLTPEQFFALSPTVKQFLISSLYCPANILEEEASKWKKEQ